MAFGIAVQRLFFFDLEGEGVVPEIETTLPQLKKRANE
jgi:hypothetical protein